MSDDSQAALANLQLGRELYSDTQRQEFYQLYEDALVLRRTTFNASRWVNEVDPDWWKFWKVNRGERRVAKRGACLEYMQAVNEVRRLEDAHPLLVILYKYRKQPAD